MHKHVNNGFERASAMESQDSHEHPMRRTTHKHIKTQSRVIHILL